MQALRMSARMLRQGALRASVPQPLSSCARSGRLLELALRGCRRPVHVAAAALAGAPRRTGAAQRAPVGGSSSGERRAARQGGDGAARGGGQPPRPAHGAARPAPAQPRAGGAAPPAERSNSPSPRGGALRAPPPHRNSPAAAAAIAAAAVAAAAKSGDAGGARDGRPPLRRASASRQAGGPVRLAKALADAGVASRRGAEALVFAGRVRVNGAVAALPQTLVTPGVDTLEVDGAAVAAGSAGGAGARHFYFALNKPAGYLCSNLTEGEKLVLDLFAPWLARWKARHAGGGSNAAPQPLPPRLFTVGRLDAATSGLLLVTNDGAWAQRVAHPSAGVTKEYIITAAEVPTKRQLATMAAGCDCDGVAVVPLRVSRVDPRDAGGPRRVLVELADGRNREVRRLAEAAGVDVRALKRTRVGGLRLPGSLKPGQFAELTFRQAKDLLDAKLQDAARALAPAADAEAPDEEGPAPTHVGAKLRPVRL